MKSTDWRLWPGTGSSGFQLAIGLDNLQAELIAFRSKSRYIIDTDEEVDRLEIHGKRPPDETSRKASACCHRDTEL